MAGVVLDHGKAMGLDVVLDGGGDVQQGVTGFDPGQALHQRLLGDPCQPLCRLRGLLANADGDAAVAVIALEVGTRIHLEQVARPDHPFVAGDAMHHLVVDRGADARREAVVALEARRGPQLTDATLGMGIEIAGGQAWCGQVLHLPQHRGDDATGTAHDLDFSRRLDLNAAARFLNARAGLDNGTRRRRCARAGCSCCLGAGEQISEQIHATHPCIGTRRQANNPCRAVLDCVQALRALP